MSDVAEFWRWFQTIAEALGRAPTTGPLVAEIDVRLRLLGVPAWEIGPGPRAAHMLALSPGGSVDKLSITRAIVRQAPAVDGWEFLPAKPPKQWRLRFRIDQAPAIQIDASTWEYALSQFSDGKLAIDIIAPGLSEVPRELWQIAALIALDGTIGEERRMTDFVDITVDVDSTQSSRSRLVHLGDHLDHLARN